MAILLSVPIIIVTAMVIGLVSPTAYLNLCKLKVTEISNQIYMMGGGKDEFLRSLTQQNLSNEIQKELQNLNSVIAQCPELRTYSNNDSSLGLVEQQSYNSNTINQA